MKKVKLFIALLLLLQFTACSEKDSQLYVKNIEITKENEIYNFIVSYYDFSSPKENYIKTVYTSENIFSAGMYAVSDKDYNFRLCENVLLSPLIISKDINNAISLINSLRIPVTTNILCYDGETDHDDVVIEKLTENPLYNFNIENNNVTASIPAFSEDGWIGTFIVYSGKPVIFLDKNQQSVLSMINRNTENIRLVLKEGQVIVNLDNIQTYFCSKADNFIINMNIHVKDCKGINNWNKNKNHVINMVSNEVKNILSDLYNNVTICEIHNLLWYENQQGRRYENIVYDINVTR